MKRILIIEDNAWERELFKDILEHAGYEVLEAPDGEIGVRLYRQSPCDLVITDIFMPEKDGLETIQELKHEFPTVSIIAVSGGGKHSRRIGNSEAGLFLQAAEGLGADRTLQKAVGVQELLGVVKELL